MDVIGSAATPNARSVIAATFRCMELAERVIGDTPGLTKHMQKQSGVFMALLPNALICDGISEAVILAHYRELCDRAVHGKPLDAATHAEALMMISAQSQRAPLNRMAMYAMRALLVKVVGADAAAAVVPHHHFQVTGYDADLIAEITHEAFRAATVNGGRGRN